MPRARKLRFDSLKHASTWLREHPDGRELLEREMAAKCEECLRPVRHRVLVLLYSDGWVEVYGSQRDLSVTVANMLHTTGPDTERLAEEYLAGTLSKRLRPLYLPRNLVATGRVERRTAAEESERLWRLDWLKAVKGVVR